MTKETLQVTAIFSGIVLGALALALDLHRHAIAAVWPYLLAFAEWQAQ